VRESESESENESERVKKEKKEKKNTLNCFFTSATVDFKSTERQNAFGTPIPISILFKYFLKNTGGINNFFFF
jgi:hypothetical protein